MGSVAAIKDEVRDAGWETRIDTFVNDVRSALVTLPVWSAAYDPVPIPNPETKKAQIAFSRTLQREKHS